ncbi:phage protease [Vibrio sp. 2-1(7)]|uniref:phage protease n=1 Tax=Vibrio sp. 2-1(7) TaxID=2591011 RepID=UPI001483CF4F|nr:phage protease [Vibrio sp. 2-1(7)]NNN64704.1 hypothetical protein [Vibrio sp. 2-1(7)]
MKTHTLTPHLIAQAVLSAKSGNEPLAVLTADLSTHDDGWYQLLPAGKFKAPDGRPSDTADGHWHLDADGAQAFIAATKALRDKVLVDYDHQTLYVEQTGKIAPAAAWLTASTDIEWREGQGIYIRPEWTSKAQSMIDEKEYAFLSAVFPYDKSGKPLYLRMAAITNDPGITKMDSVAALAADFNVRLSKHGVDVNLYGETEDAFVNEALKKLLARLGITVDGELTDEMATAALSAIDALQTKADKVDGLETQVATLSAQDGKVDLSKFVPIDAYNGVVGELAVLKADSDQTSITSLIDTAKQDGKVVEAEMAYLTQFGEQQGVASLKAMLDARPAIAALKATQTQGKKPPQEQVNEDDLSETEQAVLKATGLTKEQYLATKQEEA